jgi:hypothetical protein
MANVHTGQRVRVAGMTGARDGQEVPVTGTVRLAAEAAGLAWVTLDAAFGGNILPVPIGRLEPVEESPERPDGGDPTLTAAEQERLAFYRWLARDGRLPS